MNAVELLVAIIHEHAPEDMTNPSRSSSAWALDLPAPFGPPGMMSCLFGTGRQVKILKI